MVNDHVKYFSRFVFSKGKLLSWKVRSYSSFYHYQKHILMTDVLEILTARTTAL